MGFLRAAQTHNPELARWSTYAAIWGRQRCWRAVQNTTGVYRTPIHSWQDRDRAADTYTDLWGPAYLDGGQTVESRVSSDLESPEDAAAAHETRALMLAKVHTLPPRLQRVVVGRYYEDKTLEEIGRELGVTRERVRQLEVLALARLRRRMEASHACEL